MPFTYPPDFRPIQRGLTANPAGLQATGTPMAYGINVLAVVANIGDACTLPVAQGSGRPVIIKNEGAQQAFIFPDVGSAINAIGVNGARSLVAGTTDMYIDASPGHWIGIKSN